jgi:hypothetical protein
MRPITTAGDAPTHVSRRALPISACSTTACRRETATSCRDQLAVARASEGARDGVDLDAGATIDAAAGLEKELGSFHGVHVTIRITQ